MTNFSVCFVLCHDNSWTLFGEKKSDSHAHIYMQILLILLLQKTVTVIFFFSCSSNYTEQSHKVCSSWPKTRGNLTNHRV